MSTLQDSPFCTSESYPSPPANDVLNTYEQIMVPIKEVRITVCKHTVTNQISYNLHMENFDGCLLPQYIVKGLVVSAKGQIQVANDGKSRIYINEDFHSTDKTRNDLIHKYIDDITSLHDKTISESMLMPAIHTNSNTNNVENTRKRRHITTQNEPSAKRRKTIPINRDIQSKKNEIEYKDDVHCGESFIRAKKQEIETVIQSTNNGIQEEELEDESSDDINEGEYEVEEICGKMICGKQIYYLAVWRHFPLSSSSWEPISSFCHAKKKVDHFERWLINREMCHHYDEQYSIIPCFKCSNSSRINEGLKDLRRYGIKYSV